MKHIQEDHNRKKCPKCGKMIAANAMTRHSEEHTTREKIAKGKKVKKPTTASKKNPYIDFCRQERPKIKQDHPLYNLGHVNAELGRRWRELTDDEKEDYRGDVDIAEATGPAEREEAAETREVVISFFFSQMLCFIFLEIFTHICFMNKLQAETPNAERTRKTAEERERTRKAAEEREVVIFSKKRCCIS